MLYALIHYLSRYHHGLILFDTLTLRALLSGFSALVIALLVSPTMIRWLKHMQIGQWVRNDGPQSHLKKSGTPTMGGVLIVLAIVISLLLWGDFSRRFVYFGLFVLVAFAVIGWLDDYKKVLQSNAKGLSARAKFLSQSLVALLTVIGLYFTSHSPWNSQLFLPLFKQTILPMGALSMLLGYFVIVGSSNAVNLTDGLDGLALFPVILVAIALGIFAYLSTNVFFAHQLMIPYIPGSGEFAIFCAAIAGAGLGFLWFNTYPAQVFMGDVGALALGAALGLVAVAIRQEIVFLFMAGGFVMETVSVILQVASFKLTGKRIFRMAPIHHHFELKGWAEPKVIVRFWIITFILVLCGLATLI